MKRLIFLVMVLCVVAPASFGVTYLDEYTWTGTTGNFTDTTAAWSVSNTNDPAGKGSRPAVPSESANTTDWTNYTRPQITAAASVVTINSDLAPLNVGFQQFQLDKGSVIVDAGGKLVIGQGYMTAGAKNTAAGGGLFVRNGGTYKNLSSGTGNQAGLLLTYSSNATGSVTISGLGTLFETVYMYGSQYTRNTTVTGLVNVIGSGSTINTGTVGPGGTNKTMVFSFTTDDGGVSKINVGTLLSFNNNYNGTSTTGNISKLNFVLGAAPVGNIGDTITLFDLAANATQTGKLKNMAGTTLNEGMHVFALYGETWYQYTLSYVGGATNNDVVLTLTSVPEPATLGLLSLGGLLLARRRRA